ncbi:MAG: hypothetical protein JKY60_09145 [Kordiimonadaceae bacterium]|nr:hypothetical protein [Kordiimonadaceae bacterium]
MNSLYIVVLGGLLAAFSPTAQATDTLAEQIQHCKKITTANARLACFDAAASLAKNTANDTSKKESPVKKVYSDDDFGIEDIKIKQAQIEAARPKRLVAGLLEFGTSRNGKYFFVLNNGQIWKQVQSDTARLLVPKDLNTVKIVIRRLAFGAHSLKVDGKKRSVKVARLR